MPPFRVAGRLGRRFSTNIWVSKLSLSVSLVRSSISGNCTSCSSPEKCTTVSCFSEHIRVRCTDSVWPGGFVDLWGLRRAATTLLRRCYDLEIGSDGESASAGDVNRFDSDGSPENGCEARMNNWAQRVSPVTFLDLHLQATCPAVARATCTNCGLSTLQGGGTCECVSCHTGHVPGMDACPSCRT